MMNDSSVATKLLFEIDKYLDELVKKIELLSYVNPINIESEKVKFFASKYLTYPVFIYPDIDFDRFRLGRKDCRKSNRGCNNRGTAGFQQFPAGNLIGSIIIFHWRSFSKK